MTYQDLARLMDEAKLSPEDLGEMIGVSGMTLRRWMTDKSPDSIGKLYEAAIRDVILRLVIEQRLPATSKSAQGIFSQYEALGQHASLAVMGLTDFQVGKDLSPGDSGDQILSCLSKMGSDEVRRTHVQSKWRDIDTFRKLGVEWRERLSILKKVVTSKKIRTGDKFAAFGALFYLLSTFDLIPDFIPVFGLLDDFAIIGIAAAYYTARVKDIPELTPKANSAEA